MLRDLVLNFTLILIIVFLVHHYLNQSSNRQQPSFTSRVIIGIAMSMLGTALYYFSIILDDGAMLNFRSVVYLLAAYYGGGGTAFITFAGLWMFRINAGFWPSIENSDYALYELFFVLAASLNFKYIHKFVHRWLSGSLLFISVYQLTMFLTYPSTPYSHGITFLSQSMCMLLLVLFIYFLNQNHQYRQLVVQKEQEMLELLRRQPGFTFKIRKLNGKFEFLLLEGEMLSHLGMDMRSLEHSFQLGTINTLPPDKIQFLKKQFNRAWRGEFFFF